MPRALPDYDKIAAEVLAGRRSINWARAQLGLMRFRDPRFDQVPFRPYKPDPGPYSLALRVTLAGRVRARLRDLTGRKSHQTATGLEDQ